MTLMPVPVVMVAADRLECEDAEHVRKVSDAGEEEEESIQAFGAFAPVVEQELWDAGAEVKDCADVAENLAPEAEFQAMGLLVCGCRGVSR